MLVRGLVTGARVLTELKPRSGRDLFATVLYTGISGSLPQYAYVTSLDAFMRFAASEEHLADKARKNSGSAQALRSGQLNGGSLKRRVVKSAQEKLLLFDDN